MTILMITTTTVMAVERFLGAIPEATFTAAFSEQSAVNLYNANANRNYAEVARLLANSREFGNFQATLTFEVLGTSPYIAAIAFYDVNGVLHSEQPVYIPVNMLPKPKASKADVDTIARIAAIKAVCNVRMVVLLVGMKRYV